MVVCMASRLLAYYAFLGRSGADISVTLELLHTVTKVPLPLQGPETTSAVACTLAKELTYSLDKHHKQPDAAVILRNTVHQTSCMWSLNPEALNAIYDMAWHYLV